MTTKSINELLTQYEAGSLTRRELLAAITLDSSGSRALRR